VKDHFFALADRLHGELRAGETLLCSLDAERSDFVRFNRGRVRQAGSVLQRFLSVRLVRERRQAAATVALAGDGEDWELARRTVAHLREGLAQLPEDPWLLIAADPVSTETVRRGRLAAPEEVVQQVVPGAAGRDLVGFLASGTIYRGFANSFGQRNWHEVDGFNLEWSLFLPGDTAVKSGYAGFDWEPAVFQGKLEAAAGELALLALPPRILEPGEYRAYLGPRALDELVGLICWGGFSARARATKQSPLLRMEYGATLSPKLTLVENTAEGVAPRFQHDGFVKPASVTLIANGRLGDALVSPRSAKEYGLETNAANARESPESLDMAAGDLEPSEALAALDTGLRIGNLWYLNFSDRPAGRITGMTRFATFWVERGRVVAPVSPMRFDDSVYRMLGDNLVDLTGALLQALKFTL
jgi:predicted Zn-dependent protease